MRVKFLQESPWRSPLSVAFVKAGMELGYENRDINGANQTGFMLAQGTIRRGSRCSTGKAFIRPIKHRKNLHVALKAHVTKVNLRSQQNFLIDCNCTACCAFAKNELGNLIFFPRLKITNYDLHCFVSPCGGY